MLERVKQAQSVSVAEELPAVDLKFDLKMPGFTLKLSN